MKKINLFIVAVGIFALIVPTYAANVGLGANYATLSPLESGQNLYWGAANSNSNASSSLILLQTVSNGNFTDRFRVTKEGFVGINKANNALPTAALDVVGNIVASGTICGSDGCAGEGSGGGSDIWTETNPSWVGAVYSKNGTDVRGIIQATANNSKAELNLAAKLGSSQYHTNLVNNRGDFYLWTNKNNSQDARIYVNGQTGNVGIGTGVSDPGDRLHLSSSARTIARIQGNTASNWVGTAIFDASGVEKWFVGSNGDNLLLRRNANSNDFIINSSGDVVLNSTNATTPQKLAFQKPGNTITWYVNREPESPGSTFDSLVFYGINGDTGAMGKTLTLLGRGGIRTEAKGQTQLLSNSLLLSNASAGSYVRSQADLTVDKNIGVGVFTPGKKIDISSAVSSDGIRIKRTNNIGMGINMGNVGPWVDYVNSITFVPTSYANVGNWVWNATNPAPTAFHIGIGKIGIGTDQPNPEAESSHLLHIKSNSGNAELDLQTQDHNSWAMYHSNDDESLRFWNVEVPNGGNALTIDNSGNIGAGTTNPLGLLHLVKSSGQPGLLLQEGGNTTRIESNEIQFNVGGEFAYALLDSNYFTIYSEDNPLRLATASNINAFVIGMNGNVGIGTANPQGLLHIRGDDTDPFNPKNVRLENAQIQLYNTVDNVLAGTLGVSMQGISSGGIFLNSGGSRYLTLGTNNTERVRITNAGNVGIGTGTPQEFFHLYGGNVIAAPKFARFENTQLSFYANNALAGNIGYSQSGSTVGGIYLSTPADKTMTFTTGGSVRLHIASNGNVGIGTTNPGADRLHVEGRAYASGGWQTTNADYAEWFEKEQSSKPGDVIGINLKTGKVRPYKAGDKYIGIHSTDPGVVGNRTKETEAEMQKTHTLVGLLGQLEFNDEMVKISKGMVYTLDNVEIGVLLSNNKVLIGR